MVFAWYGWVCVAFLLYLFPMYRKEREEERFRQLAERMEMDRRLREALKTATGLCGLRGGSYRHGKG